MASDEEQFVYPPGAFPPDPWVALKSLTLTDFEEVLGSGAVRQALCRYFKRGTASGFDRGELIDFLCVSTDLLADAGMTDAEVARILSEVVPAISEREIQSTPVD